MIDETLDAWLQRNKLPRSLDDREHKMLVEPYAWFLSVSHSKTEFDEYMNAAVRGILCRNLPGMGLTLKREFSHISNTKEKTLIAIRFVGFLVGAYAYWSINPLYRSVTTSVSMLSFNLGFTRETIRNALSGYYEFLGLHKNN